MPPRQGSGPDVAFPAESKGEVFQLSTWKGVNTRSPRTSIDDQELAWSENLLRLGDGNFRSLYDAAPPLAHVHSTSFKIIHMYFYTINIREPSPGLSTLRNFYVIFFYEDGTADQINFTTGVVTPVTTIPGTFYLQDPTDGVVQIIPDVASFDANGILIICTFGYFAWDGTTLYRNPQIAPTWLTNGVAGQVMPTGSGQSIEIYKQRVWISSGKSIAFSAPLDGTKFASNGGGAFASTDSFLKSFITALRQANGFLYVFGDSSISVISNVQTFGSPAITTFNYDSVDQVVGTVWRETIRPFGRSLLFANVNGVFKLAGSAVEKISNPLDGSFRRADFQYQTPRAAYAVIFAISVYILVFRTLDPLSNTNRSLAFIWDGEHWYPASQFHGLYIITQQEIDSAVFAWGTDAFLTFKMFQVASNTLPKNFRTKLWRTKMQDWVTAQALRFVGCVFDHVGSGVSLSFTCDSDARASEPQVVVSGLGGVSFVNNSLEGISFVNTDGDDIFFVLTDTLFVEKNVNQYGRSLGLTVTTTSPDFSMVDVNLLVQQWAPHA
jgi:hypothetical protein